MKKNILKLLILSLFGLYMPTYSSLQPSAVSQLAARAACSCPMPANTQPFSCSQFRQHGIHLPPCDAHITDNLFEPEASSMPKGTTIAYLSALTGCLGWTGWKLHKARQKAHNQDLAEGTAPAAPTDTPPNPTENNLNISTTTQTEPVRSSWSKAWFALPVGATAALFPFIRHANLPENPNDEVTGAATAQNTPWHADIQREHDTHQIEDTRHQHTLDRLHDQLTENELTLLGVETDLLTEKLRKKTPAQKNIPTSLTEKLNALRTKFNNHMQSTTVSHRATQTPVTQETQTSDIAPDSSFTSLEDLGASTISERSENESPLITGRSGASSLPGHPSAKTQEIMSLRSELSKAQNKSNYFLDILVQLHKNTQNPPVVDASTSPQTLLDSQDSLPEVHTPTIGSKHKPRYIEFSRFNPLARRPDLRSPRFETTGLTPHEIDTQNQGTAMTPRPSQHNTVATDTTDLNTTPAATTGDKGKPKATIPNCGSGKGGNNNGNSPSPKPARAATSKPRPTHAEQAQSLLSNISTARNTTDLRHLEGTLKVLQSQLPERNQEATVKQTPCRLDLRVREQNITEFRALITQAEQALATRRTELQSQPPQRFNRSATAPTVPQQRSLSAGARSLLPDKNKSNITLPTRSTSAHTTNESKPGDQQVVLSPMAQQSTDAAQSTPDAHNSTAKAHSDTRNTIADLHIDDSDEE